MENTIPANTTKLPLKIGTCATLNTTQKLFDAAMQQTPAVKSYPTQTISTWNVEPALSQITSELKYFDITGPDIYIIVINDEKMIQTTPRQWLEKRRKWRKQEYRHAYMEAAIEQGVAWQIKINREKRNLSQGELANMIGSRQSAISRVEDASYGRHRLETLTKIANAFDCALQVRFIPYSKLARDSDDLSPEALYAKSYTEEIAQ